MGAKIGFIFFLANNAGISFLRTFADMNIKDAQTIEGFAKESAAAIARLATAHNALFDRVTELEKKEVDRAKHAELIQGLVDLVFHDSECNSNFGLKCDCMASVALDRAKAHGFKPAQP